MTPSGRENGRASRMAHAVSAPAGHDSASFAGAVSSMMPVQLRFGDTDKLGHINNAVYASYAELGRLGFLQELGIAAATLILARLSIDFRLQVRLGDRCAIQTRVSRIGNASFSLDQVLYANDEVAAEFEAVIVWFDYDSQASQRIPDAVRDVLAGPSGDRAKL